ncbi:MAG: TetR family transcriptional regulator [Acidobacteriota bacterium]
MIKQRAHKHEDKQERRQTILDVALQLWEQTAYSQLTMAEIAERAGIAKGTIYLYFATKEHLFLALLERLLAEWFNDIDSRLTDARGRWSVERVARLICHSLEGREQLNRLHPMLESVLEHNIDYQTALNFKQILLARLISTGTKLEKRLPFLRSGEGVRLLLQMRALMIGLRQMTDNSTVVKQVLTENIEMGLFQLDFKRELLFGLTALIYGIKHR